jgi:hypothetical protein
LAMERQARRTPSPTNFVWPCVTIIERLNERDDTHDSNVGKRRAARMPLLMVLTYHETIVKVVKK